MAQVLSFASSKGGVGKSTSCAAVACALAGQGRAVLVLDLDATGTLKLWADKLPFPGVTVESHTTDRLGEALKAAAALDRYDDILIDLAGFRDVAIMMAFARSDLVIIPTGASVLDLREAAKMVKDLADVSETIGRNIPYRLLFTRAQTLRSRVADHVVNLAEQQGLARFATAMHERAAYKEIFLTRTVPTSPDGDRKAGDEVRAIVDEIAHILNPVKKVAAA